MIQFNELSITQKHKTLILDVSIKDNPNYADIYIDQVIIDTQDTYSGLGPSSEPIYTHTEPIDKKHLTLYLGPDQLNNISMTNNLFFVYVTARGIPIDENLNEEGSAYALLPIADTERIYRTIIKIISNQEDNCKDNSKLVDLILKINALDITLKTCNYTLAVQYWKKFFHKKELELLTLKCNQK